MARKNLLAGLVDAAEIPQADTAPAYPMRGASKSMVRSLDELSKQADKFLEGEAVVKLDPDTVDGSFVLDRLTDDSEQFEELKAAIAERGQDTPILVRPHPSASGRYQIVFGHRRVRVARELGRKVKAVIKAIDDRTRYRSGPGKLSPRQPLVHRTCQLCFALGGAWLRPWSDRISSCCGQDGGFEDDERD